MVWSLESRGSNPVTSNSTPVALCTHTTWQGPWCGASETETPTVVVTMDHCGRKRGREEPAAPRRTRTVQGKEEMGSYAPDPQARLPLPTAIVPCPRGLAEMRPSVCGDGRDDNINLQSRHRQQREEEGLPLPSFAHSSVQRTKNFPSVLIHCYCSLITWRRVLIVVMTVIIIIIIDQLHFSAECHHV
jgi:hypothetical protein